MQRTQVITVYVALFWVLRRVFFAHAMAPMMPLTNRLLVSWRCGTAPFRKHNTSQYYPEMVHQMLHNKNKQLVSNPYALQNHRTSSKASELFLVARGGIGRLSPNPVIQLQLVDANVALNEQPQELPVALTPKTSSRLVVPPGENDTATRHQGQEKRESLANISLEHVDSN